MYNVIFTRLIDNKTKGSYEDFGLILSKTELEIPTAKTNYIDIAGRNGTVDLTEVLGLVNLVNYENRELTLTFTAPKGVQNTTQTYDLVANFLHGQRIKIFLPAFKDYYLLGRCSIGNLDRSKKSNQIIIYANCEPFKYKKDVTQITKEIGNLPYKVIINNLKMPTIPTITVTNSVVMNFENSDYSWNEGEHLNTSILLKEGENIFTFKNGSSGNITFSYQEGKL